MKNLSKVIRLLTCFCAGLGSTALASGVSYQYTDAKSNTILVAGQDGIDHLYQYSAYGVQSDAYYRFNRQSEAMDNAPRLLTIDDNPFGYGGQRRDSSTALWSLGNGYRQYDALTGGFMQADSLSAFSGKNTENAFNYAGGNPIGYNDPTGHFKVPKGVILAGSLFGSLISIPVMMSGGSIGVVGASTFLSGMGAIMTSLFPSSSSKRTLNHISFGLMVGSNVLALAAWGSVPYWSEITEAEISDSTNLLRTSNGTVSYNEALKPEDEGIVRSYFPDDSGIPYNDEDFAIINSRLDEMHKEAIEENEVEAIHLLFSSGQPKATVVMRDGRDLTYQIVECPLTN